MKCKKCKTKFSKNQYVCPACKEQAPRHTGRLATTLIILVLVLSMVLSGGIFTWRYLGGVFAKDIFNPKDSGFNAVQNVDISKTPTLTLYVDDQNVNVGMESTVTFRVISDTADVGAVNIVNSKDDSVLTSLGSGTVTEDGKTEYAGTYIFTPKDTAEIPIRAYAGEKFSAETTIRVFAPVSEAGHEEFRNVVSELGEYVETIDFSELSPEEELDAIESWLSSNDGVDYVERIGNNVYYRTNGGVISYYTIDGTNRFILGEDSAKDDFKENTTAVEYYEKWENDRSALRQSDGDISYLPADITITNNNTLVLMPTKSANDGFQSPEFREMNTVIENSEKLREGRLDRKEDPISVMDTLQNHGLVNYGTVYFSAHGNNDNNDNSGNYLFGVFSDTNWSNWQNFERRYGNLISSTATEEGTNAIRNSTWFIMHYQSVETVTDTTTGTTISALRYHASVSSRYIMNLYRDYTFDNTVFVMASCHGLSDEEFNNFLLNRGAHCIIGSELSIRFGTLFSLYEDVIQPMYNSTDNQNSKLTDAWVNNIADGATDCLFTSEYEDEGEHITLDEYWKEYKKHVRWTERDRKKDIEVVNGNIMEENRISDYLVWTDSTLFDITITPYRTAGTNTAGRNRDAGTFDYTCKCNDQLEYITKDNKDFAFGGTGEISGTLYAGKTIRTIAADRSYTETTEKNEILRNAPIQAKRFINQGFTNIAETKSDTNGNFTFKSEENDIFPWGHYVITSKYSSYEGETSIILTEDSTNGGEFVLSGGKSKLTGYAEGKKSADNNTVITLPGTKIQLVGHDGNATRIVDTVTADSNGYFEFENIEAGAYSLTFEKEDYEGLTYSAEIKSGYEYNYEKGNFVLEPIDSSKDVVLVLDVSGSMAGNPMAATKTAATRFTQTVFGSDGGYRVSLVTFSSGASVNCSFTKYGNTIEPVISRLSTGGGTNTESGLKQAASLLSESKTDDRIIVLMSDGDPNEGKVGDELIAYADELKEDGITIYTLGFFSGISDENQRIKCRVLMEALASKGYHYEVTSESDLAPFFNDMADQVSGTAYAHITVACPVDVTVTYNGETLSSAADNLRTRTSFGTLMFDGDESDPIKVLRLREDVDYDIIIKGTDKGKMDYSISYVDSKGKYSDTRSYKNVKITKNFVAQTSTKKTDSTIMNIDENGDGKVDKVLVSKKNKDSFEFKTKTLLLYAVLAVVVLIISIVITLFLRKVIVGHMNKKRDRILAATAAAAVRAQSAASMSAFCTECGKKIAPDAIFCENCGTKRE